MQQPPVNASPCVGRAQELARLADLYRLAQEQGERLAVLEGPSGVGKSRILQEFRGRVRLEGGVVLEGRCEPGGAFGPFAEIVDRALHFLEEVGAHPSIDLGDLACRAGCHRFWYQHAGADVAPEPSLQRANLGSAPGSAELEALEKRLRFFDAIHGLLRDVAAVRAPVVMLHDLERADRGTLQLLQFLLDGTGPWSDGVAPGRSLRALFVASLRGDERARTQDGLDALVNAIRQHRAATRVEVGTLDADGVRAFLQSPDTVARVLERTGGMPEAIELLLAADPLTPEARLERQIVALPPAARALAEALAVVERPADADLLARVADVSADAAARTDFSRSALVTRTIVDGKILFAFAREADRERCYQLLPPERRRALHAKCMQVAAYAKDLEGAARHALRAGDFARAVDHALDAASSLAARHAHGEAAALLEAVIASGEGREIPIELREQLADLYRVAGDYRRALAHARAVREAAPADASSARRVGDLLTLAGQFDDAAVELEAALELGQAQGDALTVIEVEALLAELHYQRASHDQSRTWAERALRAAEDAGALALEVHARNTLGKIALDAQADAAAAALLFEENRRKAGAAGLGHQEAQALTNIGLAMLRRQDLAGAEAALTRAIDVASRACDTRDRAIATMNLAVLAHLSRDYARALGHYHEAVTLLKRLGNRPMLARVGNNLGELYLSLGDRSRAGTLCEFAAHMGGTSLPPSVAGEGLLLRGRVEAAHGRWGSAQAAFEAALRIFQRLGAARVADASLELARVALADGDVAAARQVLATLPVQESPKRAAEVALVAVDVERAAGGDTIPSARRAAELAERAGDDEILLPALVRLTRALLDGGELRAAAAILERAQEVDGRLTARVPAEAMQAWTERAEQADLTALEAALAAAWSAAPDAPAARLSRISSTPPPPMRAMGGTDVGSARARERAAARWRERYPDIVGSSPPVRAILSLLDKVAPTDALVLVRGESGTGKELVAEALHHNSPRRGQQLVKVNCAALVETLLLSELFGHERGAFTGAQARKKGRFELADGGTLFLDEIGDISPKTQVSLLRVLQEREFERVGGTQPIKVDVRIIAATHRDLEKMVKDGSFREDLYYRLRGVSIEMPALRKRVEDLPELTHHLLARIAKERGEAPKVIAPDALRMLASHRWPGNVRELENVLRSATLFSDTPVLGMHDFAAFVETFGGAIEPEPEIALAPRPSEETPADVEELVYQKVRTGEASLFELKKDLERRCIERALAETKGNITRAAQLLGMKRPRLSQLCKQYGLSSTGEMGEA